MSTLIDNSTCPDCGAGRGEECRPDYEPLHTARLHEFITNGSYLARREAHMETCAAMKAVGIDVDERDSLFLTDEEILGLYG